MKGGAATRLRVSGDTQPRGPYAMYARVSGLDQREQQTIENQIQDLDKHCKQRGIVIPAELRFIDDGISSTEVRFDLRPAGKRVIAAAQAGKFKTLLVCDWDRLGRKNNDYQATLTFLEENLSLKVHSITQPVDATSPEGRLQRNFHGIIADYEAMQIRKRTMKGSYRVAAEGPRFLGGPRTFGFQIVKGMEGAKHFSNIVLNPVESKIVLEMFKRAERGDSCRLTGTWLEKRGVPSVSQRDGKCLMKTSAVRTWPPSRVHYVLTNKIYTGVHVYGRRGGQPVTRQVPRIVSDELFERVQQRLHKNLLFSKRNAKNDYLLRGLLKCSMCGMGYSGAVGVYRCNGFGNPRGLERCQGAHIDRAHTDDTVWAEIENFLREPGDLLGQLQAKLVVESAPEANAVEKTRLQKELERKKQAKLNLAMQVAEGLDRTTLAEGLKRFDQQIAGLQNQIAEVEAKVQNIEVQRLRLASAESLLKRMRSHLDLPLTFAIKRKLIELLVEKVEVETIVNKQGRKSAQLHASFRFIDPVRLAVPEHR